ncbi:MAG: anthranilate synthase component, partial [Verrucomicrobiota bacterium]
MSDLTVVPSRERFIELAQQGNVVPVFVDFVSDAETPASAFQKLDDGGYSFLFESAEQTEQSGRYSFLGFRPRLTIRGENGAISTEENGQTASDVESADPLSALERIMARFRF